MSYGKEMRVLHSDEFKQRENEIYKQLKKDDWSDRAAKNKAFHAAISEYRNGQLTINQ